MLATLILGALNAIPGLLGKFLDLAKEKANADMVKHKADVDADAAMNTEAFKAWIAAQQQIAAARSADRASLWTAWMMPTAFGLAIYHFGAVVLDSVPTLGHAVGSWKVAALPPDYLQIEQTIIWAGVGLIALRGVTRTFSR